MDTSKEYIKMCNCDEVSENRRVEIREQKNGKIHYEIELKDGDWFYTESGYNTYTKEMECDVEVKGTTIYDPYAYWCTKGEPIVWTISVVGFDEGESYGAKKFVWLPRQDQIQEMLREGSACSCFLCLTTHIHQFVENYFEGLHEGDIDTMEQLWLAFYMSEKHSKIWKDEKWIKP